MGRTRNESLSGQQERCLLLVAEGLTTKEIAPRLGISERTVDEHIANAVAKLGAPNRQRAAALWRAQLAATPDVALPSERSDPPYSIRGETNPIDQWPADKPQPGSTSRVREDASPAFEGFPHAGPERRPSDGGADRDVDYHLRIIGRVFAIAGGLALILLALPALIAGAERIARYLLATATPS